VKPERRFIMQSPKNDWIRRWKSPWKTKNNDTKSR
jgi:hypothetical protein